MRAKCPLRVSRNGTPHLRGRAGKRFRGAMSAKSEDLTLWAKAAMWSGGPGVRHIYDEGSPWSWLTR
jgi:hypothetical protein